MHLADAFIQSRLYFFCQYVCSLGIEPTIFCANAMLYHWATGLLCPFSWMSTVLFYLGNLLRVLRRRVSIGWVFLCLNLSMTENKCPLDYLRWNLTEDTRFSWAGIVYIHLLWRRSHTLQVLSPLPVAKWKRVQGRFRVNYQIKLKYQ